LQIHSTEVVLKGLPWKQTVCVRGYDYLDTPSGELEAFELDELIHRYKKAVRELWTFCGYRTHGRSAGFIARTLEEMQGRGEAIDWWERGNPERRRRS